MCGIAGILRPRVSSETPSARASRACSKPSVIEVRTEKESTRTARFFGHRRLAIIDSSSSGNQPMANETEDVWLSLNGEIL